jgi:hypothetical protein
MDTTPDATETTTAATEGGGEPRAAAPPSPGSRPSDGLVLDRPAPSGPPVSGRGIALGFGIALLAAIVVLQAITLASVSGQRDEVAALRNEVAAVSGSVGGLTGDLSDLGDRVDALSTAGAASSVDGAAPTGIPGGLPPYQGPGTQDAALGSTVSAVTAREWYSEGEMTVSPGDGTARVYLVWAHWCPFCQQDLDVLRTWWPENKDRFPNTDLVSVSTFQDETRSNPLDEYLETSQFDFPVLLDDTQATLAITLGNGGSVPYWVFTDGSGAVVGRHAGLLEQEQIENVFAQLEELATGA